MTRSLRRPKTTSLNRPRQCGNRSTAWQCHWSIRPRGEWLERRILLSAAPTSITVSASANSAVYGQAVNLTANVSASPTAPSEGNVAFFDNGTLLATQPVTSGVATLGNVYLPAGTDLITASYSDASGNFASSSTLVGPNSIITTVAGNGSFGFGGDGGPATAAELDGPYGAAVDSSGDLFIADYYNNRIREVNHATGVITTVAGNGTAGFSGDGGPATAAELDGPWGVAVDSSGDLFIADTYNQRIREVNLATGVITTVAGNGTYGFSGDGGPATAAKLNYPEGVAVDSSGDLFIADEGNNRIREVNHATGVITTVAGNGTYGFSGDGGPATAAELRYPAGVAVDSSGNLFIADYANNRIREVDHATGVISTVAGNGTAGFSGDGGPATAAELTGPTGVAVDSSGNLFIADNVNNRIREVDLATGVISTAAGNGTLGFSGDGGPATAAELYEPAGVAVDSSGDLFIADAGNSRLREVASGAAVVNVTPPPVTTSVALDGSGNLVIADTASGGKNDNVALSFNATNSEYIITDPTAMFSTTVGTANGQHEVDVPAADVTGKIEVNTGAGSDTLTVDYSGGTPLPAAGLAYDGGTGTLDQLIVTGYSGVPLVSASTGPHSGTVQVGTGAPTISYTDLSPIILAGAASTLTLNLAGTGVANTGVLLGDDGGVGDPDGTQNAGFLAISGSTFEYTEFANPSQSLTVQLGNSGDTISVAKLDSAFAPSGPKAFVINGGTGIDHLNVQATPAVGLAIDGKGGADAVIVGSTAPTLGGTLANIVGALSVADTGSKAALTIDDSGDTAAKTAIGINKSAISNFATAAINYTGTQISSITLDGGSGGNTFTFNPPAITNTFTVNAGAGDNALKVNNATAAATDTWQVKSLDSGIEGKITFNSVAHLIGGAGPDVFKIFAAGKVTSIDGGGGAPAGQGNWLDYSVFKTSVNVNLANGATTNINGGANGAVANIQDARGGSGNDTLSGDAQGNILVGGAGNDVLNGGSGLSLLIGGKGADTIYGGSGGDLIIGDSTKYDTNNTALMDILAEWQSAKSYATRVADIENGGGLNKSFVLGYGTGTVIDDKAADQLYGGVPTNNPDDDWFFQGVAVADTIFNWETGEIISHT